MKMHELIAKIAHMPPNTDVMFKHPDGSFADVAEIRAGEIPGDDEDMPNEYLVVIEIAEPFCQVLGDAESPTGIKLLEAEHGN